MNAIHAVAEMLYGPGEQGYPPYNTYIPNIRPGAQFEADAIQLR